MIITGYIAAAFLCVVVSLASYLHLLYVESLRLRPREAIRSLKFFEQELQPRLGFDASEAVTRYSLVRQLALVLLSIDIVLLALRGQDLYLAAVEALILSLTALVVFSQMAPSVLAGRTTGGWILRLLAPARAMAWAIQPFVLLSRFASSVADLGTDEPAEERSSTPSDDIEVLLDAGEEEGLIGREDRKLIQSVVEFGDKTVREVMTPRPNMVAIEAGKSAEELRQLLIHEEYSRVPVYNGSIDRIDGFVHTRDTLDLEEDERKNMKVRDLMRPIGLVPETKPINELLREMQDSNTQMSIVVDEYGQTAGLVTMEDLMEEIVGEIRDESEPGSDVVEQADHSFVVSGNLDVDRLEELVDYRPDEEFESTTLGGLVCEQLGRVPIPGTRLALDGILIEVLAADERRVSSARVRRLPSEAESPTTVAESLRESEQGEGGA